ncbi:alanyl-tRNA synthetase [Wenjunlia tyrosinilytica]|uniref:Alanyl-tRNA synthetase n=1 Tax=Wenjunlia tyrosinilytica TaxID=1544741 RepID=A0A918DZJ0_9ACTN|nr:alanyl-tRNA synthetase [Wenjunlia tyrosinilytica]GGO95580.1 alanyl-tRNA synthetase [Wenjunlia tyrosinilytica]
MVLQHHLYLTDTYATEVATTVARSGRDDSGVVWVALAENIFHPQGGGQPADRGTVGGLTARPRRDDAGWVVLDLPEAAEDSGAVPAPGTDAVARVDADVRRLHAALHTAGHLVHAFVSRLGFAHVGNSHFPGQARVDYALDDREVDRDALTEQLNKQFDEAVRAATAVTADHRDGVRNVTIEGLHTEPCAGTHVPDLSFLREVRIRSIKVKGGRMRVGYEAEHAPTT